MDLIPRDDRGHIVGPACGEGQVYEVSAGVLGIGVMPKEVSSGNVFADLGLKNPEELLAKAQIVQRIADIIAERKLTQAQVAKVLGIDKTKVSALLRGKLSGFSTDRVFRFLNALGRDVEIVTSGPLGMKATQKHGLSLHEI
jgi:predicted XRE-type DNA-binding protein